MGKPKHGESALPEITQLSWYPWKHRKKSKVRKKYVKVWN